MMKNNATTSNPNSEAASGQITPNPSESKNRRKALLQIGKYSTYVAPILLASMSGKVQAGS